MKVDPNINVILTACLAVFVGCYRSVKSTPPTVSIHPPFLNLSRLSLFCVNIYLSCIFFSQETMSKAHAMRFPLVGSAMLLSLFLLFKFLSKDLVNAVLTSYFFVLGILALSYVLFVWIVLLWLSLEVQISYGLIWVMVYLEPIIKKYMPHISWVENCRKVYVKCVKISKSVY